MGGLPVTAVARRTSVYTKDLPTRITVAGNPNVLMAFDAYGPIQTDEYIDVPQGLPIPSGTSLPIWSKALPAEENLKAVKRRGQLQRSYDPSLLGVLINSDQKTLSLDLSQAHTKRFSAPNTSGMVAAPTSGVGSADFGVTTYNYDNLGRIKEQKGDRDGFSAVETRTYMPGLPLLQETTKPPLVGPGGPYLPNPNDPSIVAGKTFTWDNPHVQVGPSSVKDKIDGRTETFHYDSLGRATSHTDVLGVTTTTEYDSWGRKSKVLRQAKGLVGQSSIETHYDDVNGRWKDDCITADGKTLRTRTEMDAFGRITKITTYDAGGVKATEQTFEYDGFGQKKSQSPVLTRNQQSWGNESWSYDSRGRLQEHWDAKRNILQKVIVQPVWTSIQGVTGVWTTTQDDRGYQRSEAVDLLGQKRAVIDQASQLSEYFYDQDGHLLQTIQGTGASAQQRSYTYNAMGWLTSRTEPEEGTTRYDRQFNMFGTPLGVDQYGRGGGSIRNSVTTTLDRYLRPITTTVGGPEGTVSRSYRYLPDPNDTRLLRGVSETSNLLGLPVTSLSESYEYDDLSRLISKTVSDGSSSGSFSVSRRLDASGRVTSLTYPSGGGKAAATMTTTFDALFRPAEVKLDGALRGFMAYDQTDATAVTSILTLGNGATTLSKMNQGELVLTQHATLGGVIETNAMTWSPGGLMLSRGRDSFGYDALQRLNESHVYGVYGELVDQWYAYDAFGNRTQSNFFYTPGGGGSVQPAELRAWRANYPNANDLPPVLTALGVGAPAAAAVIGTYDSGVLLDSLGRQTRIYTTPGDTNSLTTWIYDPSGRVVKENGTSYLLDIEGLRFRRAKPDGSVQYTVYGFGREPLAQFEVPAPSSSPSLATTKSTRAGRGRGGVTPTMLPVDGGGGGSNGPAGAYITQPSGAITIAPGTTVNFVGATDFGSSFTWTFGDGGTATGLTASHQFLTVGSFTVAFRASASGYVASTASVVVTVMNLPSITSFTASPGSILTGQSTTLSWVSSGASSLSINQGVGAVGATGSTVVSPTVTTTYILTATNAAGSVSATVTVGVSIPPPPAISSFTATPARIAIGQSTTLAWSVTNAVTITISGIGPVAGSSVVVSPISTTTYTLTATNSSGTASTSITVVVVTQLPTITDFFADPYTISPGGSTTLKWYVSQADSLSVNGTPVVGNSMGAAPANTTTYTLMATNLLGSVTAAVTVGVGVPGGLVWKKFIVYGFGQELAEEAPGMGTTFIQSDFVGSPSVMTDPGGTVIGRSKNLPFGERMASWGGRTIRRYTNHEDDPDSGAIYMQAREYLPAYGKFAQVDPAYDQTKDDPESWNLYNYVTNNPVTKTDPDGRMAALPLDDSSHSSSFTYVSLGDMLWVMSVPEAESLWYGLEQRAMFTFSDAKPNDSTGNGLEKKTPSVKTDQNDGAQTNTGTNPPPPRPPGIRVGSTDSNVTAEDLKQVTDAVKLLSDSPLTRGEKAVLKHMKSVNVFTGEERSAMDLSTGTFNFNVSDFRGQSVAWTASEVAHDSFHQFRQDTGAYQGTGVFEERLATKFQLEVGGRIGLEQRYIQHLNDYINSADAILNRIAEPAHQ